MKNLNLLALAVLIFAFSSCKDEPKEIVETIDFETLTVNNDGYWDGSEADGSFTAGNISFVNNYNADWFSWDGFAFSNLNDTETAGYGNQYSVFDANNEGNTFVLFYQGMNDASATFNNGNAFTLKSISVCNSTYVAKSILEGDAFTKKFGGETGADQDYFKMTFTGYDANDTKTADVEFYLADYRSETDVVIDKWTDVDLSGLGEINKLTIKLESTDNGDFGMNTPGYVCLDNIKYVVPEEE